MWRSYEAVEEPTRQRVLYRTATSQLEVVRPLGGLRAVPIGRALPPLVCEARRVGLVLQRLEERPRRRELRRVLWPQSAFWSVPIQRKIAKCGEYAHGGESSDDLSVVVFLVSFWSS